MKNELFCLPPYWKRCDASVIPLRCFCFLHSCFLRPGAISGPGPWPLPRQPGSGWFLRPSGRDHQSSATKFRDDTICPICPRMLIFADTSHPRLATVGCSCDGPHSSVLIEPSKPSCPFELARGLGQATAVGLRKKGLDLACGLGNSKALAPERVDPCRQT